MADIPKGGFTEQAQLEAYLKSLPNKDIQQFSTILATRTALRTLPFIAPVDTSGYFGSENDQLALGTYRACLVASLASLYQTNKLKNAAAEAAINARIRWEMSDDRVSSVYVKDAGTRASGRSRLASLAAFSSEDNSKSITAILMGLQYFDPEHIPDYWRSLTDDVRYLTTDHTVRDLYEQPIWMDKQPDGWGGHQLEFYKKMLSVDRISNNFNWIVWWDWYNARINGRPAFDLPLEIAEALEMRIALGDSREGFWDREPHEVNAEIAKWVAEARAELNVTLPIFISYNNADKTVAKDIGDVLDGARFKTFAQYKDMPPGSNFIVEMQTGLAKMGKFCPVYSPQYNASDICQDEWNTAYNMDRGGRRRLIIGFVVRPMTLSPLQKQIVHVPLYGISKEAMKQEILEAFNWNGEVTSMGAGRKDASDSASPEPYIDASGKISVSKNAPSEQHYADEDLASLPDSLRQTINRLLEALTNKNVSNILTSSLRDYRIELLANAAAPRIADLVRAAEIIFAEIGDAKESGAGWHTGGISKALEQFGELHERFRQHFPMFMIRDLKLAKSPIDPQVFDSKEFGIQHNNLLKGTIKGHEQDIVDEEFKRVIEWRENQRQDIKSLRESTIEDDMFLTDNDRILPSEIKKRFLFDLSGTGDKLLERTANVSAIADSSAGKLMIGSFRELLKLIWGGS